MITETWCNDDISNSILNIDGYYIENDLRIDKKESSRGIGGGIIVYVRKDLTVKCDDIDCNFSQHCKFCLFDENMKKPLNFILFYRSPNSSQEIILT